jgi:tetratricopeptide (TPR) repeat protein
MAGRPDDPNAEVLFRQGLALARAGDASGAAAAYEQAVALDPDHAGAWVNLGSLRRRSGRPEEAVAAYRQALRVKPDYPLALSNLGNALKDLRRFTEAADCYRRAIALKPGYADAYANLGAALSELDEPEAAVEAYQSAVAAEPASARAWTGLAQVLQLQGDFAEAAGALEKAMAADPAYVPALYTLVQQTPMGSGASLAEEAFARLHSLGKNLDPLPQDQRVLLLFALGKALDERGEHDRAFAAFAQANSLHRARLAFDMAPVEARMAAIAEVFGRSLFDRLAGAGVALGFAFFFLNAFCGALGATEVIPPLLAAWSPPVLALLSGVTLLCYTEDG